jgi:ADP-dependent NAD(P)H-hydrate dehydratase / NAD(P)H-hydrate epimerase
MNVYDASPQLLPVLTIAQLRAIEAQHADDALMERAGEAAADLAAAMAASRRGRVAVLAGPGNNGGDAFVCARRLHERGVDVLVVCAPQSARPRDAAQALQRLEAAGVALTQAPPNETPALIVDGLFGVGLSRAIGEPWSRWIAWANASAVPILALDVPSGLDASTGVARERAIATETAAFIAQTPGLLTCDGPDHCGNLSVHDLGLDVGAAATGVRLDWCALGRFLPAILARHTKKSHKGTYGRACIVGGSEGLVGAALLAGRAALRLGAGRVVVLSPELMLRRADALGTDHDAWVVGPGLGGGDRARDQVEKVLALDAPLVLDADALNAIARERALFDAVAKRSSPTLATPHPAEAARLMQCTTADVQADRVAAATHLASSLRANVVLKGAGSIVARPDGTFDVNASGNPALATAGSGDVLAGILGALLAQGIDANDALRIGVCVHGAAGDLLVARGVGPLGVVASELMDAARTLVNDATRAPAKR